MDDATRNGLIGWGKGLMTIGMLVSGVLLILLFGWSEGLLYYGLGTLGCGLVLVTVGAWAPRDASADSGRWDEAFVDRGASPTAEHRRVAALQTERVHPFPPRDEGEWGADEGRPWRDENW